MGLISLIHRLARFRTRTCDWQRSTLWRLYFCLQVARIWHPLMLLRLTLTATRRLTRSLRFYLQCRPLSARHSWSMNVMVTCILRACMLTAKPVHALRRVLILTSVCVIPNIKLDIYWGRLFDSILPVLGLSHTVINVGV